LIQGTSAYETNSGTLPQQIYLEVPQDKVYTWNDYNANGIQELQEFEVAPFIDQAKYIRVYLPNRVYIKTHQTKFSQSIIFKSMAKRKGFKNLARSFTIRRPLLLIVKKTKVATLN
jgi:hypothetical protein